MSASSDEVDKANPAVVINTNTSFNASKNANNKKLKKKEKRSGKRNREICDVFGEAAMTNAYNISHNVQDMLYFRGFSWAEKKK